MRSVVTRLTVFVVTVLMVSVVGHAQRPDSRASTTDPRVGLKAGFRDAGIAAKNMVLVATMPKPDGFFNPNEPTGPATPPEAASDTTAAPPPPTAAPASSAPAGGDSGGLNFANSDLAFSGTRMIMGSFQGFQAYDIERTNKPQLLASVVCPGGQGDVSVWGNLLFMSVEQTRGRVDCGLGGVDLPVSAERFRGVRIFDISDLRKPRQVAAVQTCRGSHTHTLVPSPKDKSTLYVYGSGTGQVRPGEELEGCSGLDPTEDGRTALFSIDVIEVPLATPEKARIVNRPRIFADEKTGAIAGLWAGGDHGPGTQRSRVTSQCHDITVFPEAGLAAGACSGNGILMDISDPPHPVRLDYVVDKNFAAWHSATFNNDGTKVVFTDEWGGGTRPRCRAGDPIEWGADAVFDIVDRKLRFRSFYKMPAAQTEQENCVAHNGSIIPVPGRDIMVQGWYQGGVSVFDFTDSAHPTEIAYFDRGPIDAARLITGGYWSTYWFNGSIFGSEIARGMDVFKLLPSEYLSQNEIDAAILSQATEFNAQNQTKVTWPAVTVVARAYLDQLNRTRSLAPGKAAAVKRALDIADGAKNVAAADQLVSVAGQLETDAAAAVGPDGTRMRALAATMKGRAAGLR